MLVIHQDKLKEKMTEIPFWDDSYTLWLLLSHTRSAIFKARQNRIGKYVHFNMMSALVAIWRKDGRATPAGLSRRLFLEPHSVSELLTRMEKKGYIIKQKDSEKENVIRISITEEGREFCVQAVQPDYIRDIMNTLSVRQRKQLRTCLQVLFTKTIKDLGTGEEADYLQ